MAELINPAAPHHLPSFITAPGDTDVLMVVMSFASLFAIVAFGVFFFRLHTLPERMAHHSQKVQFEIVAVLGLVSLFTHMHIFWIIGLFLALIDIPDFGGWLARIAGSVEKIAGIGPGEGGGRKPPEIGHGIGQADGTMAMTSEAKHSGEHGDHTASLENKSATVRTREKESGRA